MTSRLECVSCRRSFGTRYNARSAIGPRAELRLLENYISEDLILIVESWGKPRMPEAIGRCKCGDCVFWDHICEDEGLCRRHAPAASQRAGEVARWPETRTENSCAEGIRTPDRGAVKCAACIYWSQPIGGLSSERPAGEKTGDWWRHAGHCLRHAPQPSSEPGARGFWRATSAGDSCGDGQSGTSK
jgi:hypothetical protein